MLFIRSSLYFLGMAISAIIISIVSLLLFFLPLHKRYYILTSWQRFCLWWLRMTCNITFHISGLEHIPTTPCVVVSNHQSTLDVLLLPLILPPHTGVLKKQLLYIPFFGWGLALMNPIVINREKKLKALKAVITQGINRLQKGLYIIIYPEGTRGSNDGLAPYQTGGMLLAKEAHASLLPLAHNAGMVWQKGTFIKRPGVVHVRIGKPITTIDKPKQTARELYEWTKEQLDEIATL